MKNGPYEFVVAPSDYPGKKYRGRYCYEHHLVWWQHTGETIAPGEVVHHVNGDKRDNRIENLRRESMKKHSADHGRERAQQPIRLQCAWCAEEFTRTPRSFNHKFSQGQRYFYCCQSHATRAQKASPNCESILFPRKING